MDQNGSEGRSQIALYGTGASSCGYCASSSKSGRISYGVDSQLITPSDYQALIDRGWRRSGAYIYLPDNKLSCCPNWTIRLHVPDFRPSRQHRKVKNKFDNYVKFGPKKKESSADMISQSPDAAEIAFTEMQSYLRCAIDEAQKSSGENPISSYNVKLFKNEFVCNVALVLASWRRKKSKTLAAPRAIAAKLCSALQGLQLRDGEHSIAISNDDNGFLHLSCDSFARFKVPNQKKPKTSQASKSSAKAYVRFSARLCPAQFSKEAFDIYRLYQVAVHKDEIDRLSEQQYRNFLCDSPIITQRTADPNISYGSFHVEYRFDDKLIGVSVIDILPKCVSSVYFFYDPDYAFLSLGVWSALYELSLVPNSLLPDLRYYYLGYYVHNCPKMRYKKQFAPAELLCHEKFSWHPLDKCIVALDSNPYVAFSKICDPSSPPDKESQDSSTSVDDIPFMLGGQHFLFRDLREVAKQRLSSMMQEYFEKFGFYLATRRFVITNIYMTSQ